MKTRTRNVAMMLTCLAFASSAAAQAPRRVGEARPEASETFSHTARLVPGGTFELRNAAGDVTVTGGSVGREVRIDATKRVRNVTNARARTVLNAIQVLVAERGGNVEVRTRGVTGGAPPNRPAAMVDFTIVLPENANVILRSTSGNLRLQNVAGDQFDVHTLSGDVVMQALTGRMLDLHTVTGNMVLQDVAAEGALLQSMAGNLEFAGRLARTGRYKFQTHKGNIRVAPSGTPGFDLDAMTYKGSLRSEFVLNLLRQPGGAQRMQRNLRGTFGDAGAALTASSFSGNIVIIKP